MYLLGYTIHFNDIIVYLGKLHASLIRYCDQCDSILMRMVLVAMRMLIAGCLCCGYFTSHILLWIIHTLTTCVEQYQLCHI